MKTQVVMRFLILLGIATLGIQEHGFSQKASGEFVVEGRVNDPNGKKAIGAAILVKGTTIGTVTDTTGYFTLKVPSENAVLVISHFSTTQSLELPVNGSKKHVVRLAADPENQHPVKLSEKNYPVFDRVEENPRPIAGANGWYAYLSKNIKYSKNDRKAGVEGTVIVGFEIHADGSVQNVELLRGIGGESDQEAIRVVASGPAWEPGKIAGESVNTRMSMPIQFRISGSENSNATSKESTIAKLYGKEGVVVIGYQTQAFK